MNHQAVLALIADLYQQITTLQQKVVELEAKQVTAQEVKPMSTEGG